MTTTEKIIAKCELLGVRLQPHADKIRIEPPENTTPELVEEIRAHKREILAALESRRRSAESHLCRQVLSGEFGECDAGTVEHVAGELCAMERTNLRDAALVRLGKESRR